MYKIIIDVRHLLLRCRSYTTYTLRNKVLIFYSHRVFIHVTIPLPVPCTGQNSQRQSEGGRPDQSEDYRGVSRWARHHLEYFCTLLLYYFDHFNAKINIKHLSQT
jgi:hypothetical protein